MTTWDSAVDRDDLVLIQDLSRRLWSRTSFFHPGGQTWGFASSGPHACRVWGSRDRLVAWAYVGDGELGAHIDPSSDVASDVVEWACSVGATRAVVPNGHDHLRDAVTARGFTADESAAFALDMRRPTTDPPVIELPAGFCVRSVTSREFGARVAVHRAAWAPSRFTATVYQRVRAAPLYREDLDIVAVAPDGSFGACCIAWLDEQTTSAEIEPVGTDPVHRRRRLASAICAFAVVRLGELGAREVTIQPRGDDGYPVPRAVYAQLGFETVNRTVTYTRR